MVGVGLTKVTLSRLIGGEVFTRQMAGCRTFQTEKTANVKGRRWESLQLNRGLARRVVWLKQSNHARGRTVVNEVRERQCRGQEKRSIYEGLVNNVAFTLSEMGSQ